MDDTRRTTAAANSYNLDAQYKSFLHPSKRKQIKYAILLVCKSKDRASNILSSLVAVNIYDRVPSILIIDNFEKTAIYVLHITFVFGNIGFNENCRRLYLMSSHSLLEFISNRNENVRLLTPFLACLHMCTRNMVSDILNIESTTAIGFEATTNSK